jgi:DNA-binding response OmpR family regulator
MRLLLVEDDASMGLLFERLLTRLGYEVCVKKSAEEAWEHFQQEPCDLVITDWVLPGMSGLELCKRLRSLPFGEYIYICVVTARNTREDLLEVLEAGANDYLDRGGHQAIKDRGQKAVFCQKILAIHALKILKTLQIFMGLIGF